MCVLDERLYSHSDQAAPIEAGAQPVAYLQSNADVNIRHGVRRKSACRCAADICTAAQRIRFITSR